MFVSIGMPFSFILFNAQKYTNVVNKNTLIILVTANIMNTLLEAFTTQNDNLLLPIHLSVLLLSLLELKLNLNFVLYLNVAVQAILALISFIS